MSGHVKKFSARHKYDNVSPKVWEKKRHTFKNWPLIKNPHFCPIFMKLGQKKLTHEVIIFTKFHEDWKKIVDFL